MANIRKNFLSKHPEVLSRDAFEAHLWADCDVGMPLNYVKIAEDDQCTLSDRFVATAEAWKLLGRAIQSGKIEMLLIWIGGWTEYSRFRVRRGLLKTYTEDVEIKVFDQVYEKAYRKDANLRFTALIRVRASGFSEAIRLMAHSSLDTVLLIRPGNISQALEIALEDFETSGLLGIQNDFDRFELLRQLIDDRYLWVSHSGDDERGGDFRLLFVGTQTLLKDCLDVA